MRARDLQSRRPGLTPNVGGAERRHRTGVAAMEAAVSLPILVVLVFGSMEIANAIFLKQSLNMAAYEAAKLITAPGDNNTLAATRCAEVVSVRRVTSHTLTISPAVTAATARGTQITVTVSASSSNLSYGPVRFMAGRTISSAVSMVRL